jgi:hypothetical protein
VEAAILRKSPAAPESARALDGQLYSVTIRQKVHVTHFLRYHDDWDFDSEAWVIEETDTHIRVADSPRHLPGELVVTFRKDPRELLIKRLPL